MKKIFLSKAIPKLTFKKGSILMEALLSVVILSVSLTVMIQSLSGSLKAQVDIANYPKAIMLLENTMFDVVRLPFISSGTQVRGAYAYPYEDYQYQVDTRQVDGTKQRLYQLTATVFWDTQKRHHEISSGTYHVKEPSSDE
jgi:hypothetical protein